MTQNIYETNNEQNNIPAEQKPEVQTNARPLSGKEQRKLVKLEKARARSTEDWMKREKKIIIIFSIVCAVLLILAIIGFALRGSSATYADDSSSYSEYESSTPASYEAVTADELIDALEENAAAATEKYDGEALAITGKLLNTDADSEYISIQPLNDDFAIDSILCYTTTEELKDQAKQLKAGQTITVKGTVSEIDDVFGYYVDTDSIETN